MNSGIFLQRRANEFSILLLVFNVEGEHDDSHPVHTYRFSFCICVLIEVSHSVKIVAFIQAVRFHFQITGNLRMLIFLKHRG